jgi:superfamily II DNA/RNA helicase
MDKVEMLARILQAEGRGLTLVFCRTKRTAAKVADELADRGFASGAVHGDLGQGAREQALRAFRSGKVDVLVATDVAARGIDVDDITHVINYQCPDDEKTYLHRIGRTARAGKSGVAITFVDWDETARWMLIDRALDLGFGEPEETYSSSEHLYEELEIPREVTGRLPRAKRTRAGLDAEMIEDLGETGRKPASTGARGRDRGRGGPGEGRDSGAGRSGRSGRDDRAGRGDRGDRTDRPAVDAPSDTPARAERAASPRQRRRTRGGGAAAATQDAPAAGGTAASADAAGDGDRPKRRRRRGGRGRTGAGGAEGNGGDAGGPAESSE